MCATRQWRNYAKKKELLAAYVAAAGRKAWQLSERVTEERVGSEWGGRGSLLIQARETLGIEKR